MVRINKRYPHFVSINQLRLIIGLNNPVLEIGCFSGYSAIAWYEGTKETQAEIVTLELSPKMIAASKEAFAKFGVTDRVTLVEGPAGERYVAIMAMRFPQIAYHGSQC